MLKLSRNADNACRRETAARGAHRERRGASVKRVPRRERRSCNRLVTERRRTRTRPGVVVTETGPGAPGRVRKPGSQFLSVRPFASGFSRSGSRFDRTNHPEPMILIGSVRSFKIPCPRTAKVSNRFPPPTAQSSQITRGGSLRIHSRGLRVIIFLIPVRHKLGNISMHVVEPESIRLVGSHHAGAAQVRPRGNLARGAVGMSAVKVCLPGAQRVSEVDRRLGSRAASIFPLGLRWQTGRLCAMLTRAIQKRVAINRVSSISLQNGAQARNSTRADRHVFVRSNVRGDLRG